jgi:hypothetical protein
MSNNKKRAYIGTTDLENPKKTPKPLSKTSAWFVTVNTHVPFADSKDPNLKKLADVFHNTLDVLMNEEFQDVLKVNARVKNRDYDNSMSEW